MGIARHTHPIKNELLINHRRIIMIVLLKDGTTGSIDSAAVGDEVTVALHDENGMPIEVTGIVEEILVA